jgi:hypothetical protein
MAAEHISTPVYQVTIVEKIDTPEGMAGSDWHRYVIRRKGSTINGIKTGSLDAVTQHAEDIARDLNLRASGMSSSVYTARKYKK